MDSPGTQGARKREGKKYAVEDEALDRIAKEVIIFVLLLSLILNIKKRSKRLR